MAICFVANTNDVDDQKLYKLFYSADRLAVERTAFSISDQPYFAGETGPMPVSPDKKNDIISSFALHDVITPNDNGIYRLIEGITFNKADFTDAELEVLRVTCEAFRDVSGAAMSEQSHAIGESWRVFMDEGNQLGDRMPFEELIEREFPSEEQVERQRFRKDARESQAMFESLFDASEVC